MRQSFVGSDRTYGARRVWLDVLAVGETVSGSVAAKKRAGFKRLVDRLEAGDVLIVTKLDRLGRNAMDVRSGVRVHA